MIQFAEPKFLFLILLIIPTFIFTCVKVLNMKKKVTQFTQLKSVFKNIILRAVFFSLAWCFIVLGIAKPLWGTRLVLERKRGTTVLFVMDISKSMSIDDLLPNRLTIAKAYAKLLLQGLEQTSCGLVLAKGNGVLAIPATFEKESMEIALENLSFNSLSSVGTNIEAGILTAIESFPKQSGTSKTIVLFTDGDETLGSMDTVYKQLQNKNVQLIIVGFGTIEGGDISIFDNEGIPKIITSKLEEKKLQDVVNKLDNKGLYIRYDASGSLNKILTKIDLKDSSVEIIENIQRPAPHSFEMSLIAFLFLCCGILSGGSIWKKN